MYSTIITVSIVIIVLIILITSLFLLTKNTKFHGGGITKKSDRRIVVTDIIPLWDSYGPDEKCFITMVYEQIANGIEKCKKQGQNRVIIQSTETSDDNTTYANSYEVFFINDAFGEPFWSIMERYSDGITDEVIEKCESEEGRFEVIDKKQTIATTIFQRLMMEYLIKIVDGQPIFNILTFEQRTYVDSKLVELTEINDKGEYTKKLNELATDIVDMIGYNYKIIYNTLKNNVKPNEMQFNKKPFISLFRSKDHKNKFIFDFVCWKYLQLPKLEQL